MRMLPVSGFRVRTLTRASWNDAQSALRRLRIVDVEEFADPLDIAGGILREQDHPMRCGSGRGNSLSVPQLSTHAFT